VHHPHRAAALAEIAMSLEQGFLDAIRADPDDDTPRLVFADWLEEQGNPRGEFLRLQCRLGAWVPDLDERTRLQQREQQLLAEHGAAWLGELGPKCKDSQFRRGTCRITMNARSFAAARFERTAAELLDRAWVDEVRLLNSAANRSLVRTPALASVAALDLSRTHLTAEALEVLLRSPHLGKLVRLDLDNNALPDGTVYTLIASGLLGQLRHLDLRNNALTNVSLRHLLEAARSSRSLRRLDLQGNDLDEHALEDLVQWRQQHEQAAPGGPPPRRFTNSLGMEFVWIPAGTFRMGSDESDDRARPNEKPAHVVTLTKPYYLCVFEVTQAWFERVTGRNPSHFHTGRRGGPHHPVEMVSWDDAMEFCNRLSELPREQEAGRVYRLPTEAEWEHACRAGTYTPFHQGFIPSPELVNYDGNHTYGGVPRGASLRRTTPVGSYPPNAWGLFDMHGNVWEWCHDFHHETYYTRSPKRDPKGPKKGRLHAMRGGCWDCVGWYCRAAHRHGDPTRHTDTFTGFRVALNVP
jgi:uncharacterized protein (TIGR02996 family)